MDTRAIIEKWYRALGFPAEYDGAFYEALAQTEIPADITVETYDSKCEDGKRNLLAYLYLCEEVERRAKERGIPPSVALDTLSDLVIWTENYTKLKGSLYLGELGWLKIHMRFTMFRLGRLQFRMTGAAREIPEAGLKKGDPVLEIHIPRGARLEPEACDEAFRQAKEFFGRYFPEYGYSCFTCYSWLLDDTLKEFLPPESNIIRFGDRFTKGYRTESNDLLDCVFGLGVNEENLADAVCTSSFSRRVKEAVLSGRKFTMTLGFIPAEGSAV